MGTQCWAAEKVTCFQNLPSHLEAQLKCHYLTETLYWKFIQTAAWSFSENERAAEISFVKKLWGGKSFVRHSTSICLPLFDVCIAVGFCSGAARLMANGVCVHVHLGQQHVLCIKSFQNDLINSWHVSFYSKSLFASIHFFNISASQPHNVWGSAAQDANEHIAETITSYRQCVHLSQCPFA